MSHTFVFFEIPNFESGFDFLIPTKIKFGLASVHHPPIFRRSDHEEYVSDYYRRCRQRWAVGCWCWWRSNPCTATLGAWMSLDRTNTYQVCAGFRLSTARSVCCAWQPRRVLYTLWGIGFGKEFFIWHYGRLGRIDLFPERPFSCMCKAKSLSRHSTYFPTDPCGCVSI